MNTILLISEEYIKENSPVYQNVDPKLLRSHIFESQNINYKYLLPTDLYNDIFTQFEAYRVYVDGGGTDPITSQVDARLLSLVDESKPMLLYYTLYNAAFSLYARITNKGITEQDSEYSENLDIKLFENMRVDWKQKGESYAALLIEFMAANKSTYPEFATADDCDSVNPAFHNPLYLGDSI
jgi:hypothetical protein